MRRLRSAIIVLMMLILPMQGFAAAYAPMHKSMGREAATAMPCHEPSTQQSVPSHDMHWSADDASSPGAAQDSDAASHLCCQQVFTGATSSVLTTAAHKFSDVSRFISPLVTLFIPDSPDRPPRG
jgi:hypothetical protein